MADSGKREDWRARAVRAEALLAEAVPMRVFEKAEAERDEWRDRQEQTSYVQQCVSDELVRTEARLAEALEALREIKADADEMVAAAQKDAKQSMAAMSPDGWAHSQDRGEIGIWLAEVAGQVLSRAKAEAAQ